jgi:saccharopine dehydrogenase (NAD+, L-lysine-forming)
MKGDSPQIWRIPMKALALGGAGQFGKRVAQILVASDIVSEIVIAGRNLDAARGAAAELGSKATAVQVDLLDEDRLASLAEGCDIMVNTAGPEHKVVLPALRAAIKAGVDYCDLCAHGPTTEKAFDLNAAAKASEVTAIMGIGLVGLSNLRMMHAANQLDQAEDIRFCVFQVVSMYGESPKAILAQWRKAGHADASWQFMMKLVAEKVRVYRDGRWVDVDPLDDAVRVTLPQGGEVTAVPCAWPEPITLPRTLRSVRSVSTLYSMYPPQLNEIYCKLGRRIARGELDESAAAFSLFEYLADQPAASIAAPGGCADWIDWVEAVGTKEGKRVRYKGWPVGGWDTTKGPLATAALKILRGDVRACGVLSPESCLDPMPFFAEVARNAGVILPDGRLLEESFEVLTK